MSFNYSRTSAQIISRALRILGILPSGQTPTTAQYTDGLEVMNSLLKELTLDGINITKQSLIQVTLNATQSQVLGTDGYSYKAIKNHTSASSNRPVTGTDWALYWERGGSSTTAWANATAYTAKNYATLSSSLGIDSVDRAIWRKNDIDYNIPIIPYSAYTTISDKLSEGEIITNLGIEYTSTDINLYLYPTPANFTSAALLLHVTTLYPDLSATSDVPGLANTWYTALSYGMASYLCDEYQKPLDERTFLYNKYQELLRKAINSSSTQQTSSFVTGAY